MAMVESLKDGDRVCFTSSKEAEHVRRLCLERGVTVECIVLDPRTPERIFERGTSEGRTVLDHSWVEQYFLQAIERANEDIARFEREASGFGAAHRETRRKALEMAKWEQF